MLIKIAAEGTFSVNPSLGTIGLNLTRQGAETIQIPSVNLPVYETTVSGQVVDNNLQITVNGVSSGDIPLPESTAKYDISVDIEDYTPSSTSHDYPDPCYNVSLTQVYSSSYNNILLTSGDLNVRIYPVSYRRVSPTAYTIDSELTQNMKTLVENKVKEAYSKLNLSGVINFCLFFYNQKNNSGGYVSTESNAHYCSYDGSNYSINTSSYSRIGCANPANSGGVFNKFMIIVR